jgi:hypothetical protein
MENTGVHYMPFNTEFTGSMPLTAICGTRVLWNKPFAFDNTYPYHVTCPGCRKWLEDKHGKINWDTGLVLL